MNAKVVFFDIDGTLYSHQAHEVPARTRRAVIALRERGVRVVIATGRHPIELDNVGLDSMSFDGFAAANGQMCLDGNLELIAGHPIPEDGVRALVELFERGDEVLWFFTADEGFANIFDEQLMAMAEMATGVVPEVHPYDGRPLYQAVIYGSLEEDEALEARLPGCKLQRWGDGGADIIAADGGKAVGMQTFLDRFGATREECVAFGDQHNDIEMLRYAGVGVAMGNASPETKEAADYVTTSVDDDGIPLALEHLGLLEPGWDAGCQG